VVVALPFDELERTAACACGSQREVGAAFRDGVDRQHHSGSVDQRGEQRRVRCAQVEDDVGVVYDLDGLDAGKVGLASRVGGRLVAFDVGFDRRGVERRPVVVLDARLQRELVVQRVGYIPGLHQARLDLQRRIDGEERVVHVVEDLTLDQKGGVEWIQCSELALQRDRGGAAGLRSARIVARPTASISAAAGKQQQSYEGKGDSSHLRTPPRGPDLPQPIPQ